MNLFKNLIINLNLLIRNFNIIGIFVNIFITMAHILSFINLLLTIIIIISYVDINWESLGVLTTLFTILVKLTPLFIVDFITNSYLTITSILNSILRDTIIKILDIKPNNMVIGVDNIKSDSIPVNDNIKSDSIPVNDNIIEIDKPINNTKENEIINNYKNYLNYYIIGGVLLVIIFGCVYYIGWSDIMDYFKKDDGFDPGTPTSITPTSPKLGPNLESLRANLLERSQILKTHDDLIKELQGRFNSQNINLEEINKNLSGVMERQAQSLELQNIFMGNTQDFLTKDNQAKDLIKIIFKII